MSILAIGAAAFTQQSPATDAPLPTDTVNQLANESSWMAGLPWQVLLGGITGAALTQCVTWIRERGPRREARNAVQREAIADVISAVGELILALSRWQICKSRKDHEAWIDSLIALSRPVNDAFVRAQLVVVDDELTGLIDALHELNNDADQRLLKASRSASRRSREAHKQALGVCAEAIINELEVGANALLDKTKSLLKLR